MGGVQSGSHVQVEYFPVIIGAAYDFRCLHSLAIWRALCRQRSDYSHHLGIVEYVLEPPDSAGHPTIGSTGYLQMAGLAPAGSHDSTHLGWLLGALPF